MKASIQKSNASDGPFTTMRSNDMQLAMQLELTPNIDNSPAISEEVERDENVEELFYPIGDMKIKHCSGRFKIIHFVISFFLGLVAGDAFS